MSDITERQESSGAPMTLFGPEQKPWLNQVPDYAVVGGKPYGTPPTMSPKEAYEQSSRDYPLQEEDLQEKYVQIPPIGMDPDGEGALLKKSLGKINTYLDPHQRNFLGYQLIEQQDYEILKPYLDMSINNIGDPFVDGYYALNSKSAERGVMDFFASLWHADWPSSNTSKDNSHLNSYWGYILSMGSTEGNLYGVLSARDYLSGYHLVASPHDPNVTHLIKPAILPGDNPNAYTPIAFYSEDTHYSVMKAVHAMGVKTFYQEGMEKYPHDCPIGRKWPEMVPSEAPDADFPIGTGAVDVEKLIELVRFFVDRDDPYPILIVLNYGTTFKGAYDNVEKAGQKLMEMFKEVGYPEERTIEYRDPETGKKIAKDIERNSYWIHVDGALGASFMPFVEMRCNKGDTEKTGPVFDFRNRFVNSIVTSGHKWPGTPAPTGIYMSKRKYLMEPPDAPEYLGAPDSTFAGSRSGFSAMALWTLAATNGYPGFDQRAKETLDLMAYAHDKFRLLSNTLKKEHDFDIWLQQTPLSMSIIFRKPIDAIMYKYSLCTASADEIWEDGRIIRDKKRIYVHMFCLWDRKREMFDSLVADLGSPASFDENSEQPISKERGEEDVARYSMMRVNRCAGMF